VTRVLALVFLAHAALAAAQPPDDRRMGPGRARDEGARMIEAYVLSNLQESLGLTDDQYVKALPLVKKLQSDRREYAQGRMRLVRQLRRTLESGGATEGQVADLLAQVKALEAEGPVRIKKSLDALDAVLTPLQQAKLRVFEVEVERKLRDLLSEIRKSHGQGRPGESPPPEEH
jgi:Spy/CpxP family protein refolding chaperone